jgi:hypothetical protein
MGNPRAKATVVLRDAKGNVQVFEEGHALPKWALAEITNPEVVDLDELDAGDGESSDDAGDGETGADAGTDSGSADESAGAADAPPADKPKPRTRARRTAAAKTTAK